LIDKAENDRLSLLEQHENEARRRGCRFVAGVDEVGAGALAGPVVACCLMFEAGVRIAGIDDSKRLRPQKREELNSQILDCALAVGLGTCSNAEIDYLGNMGKSIRLAMERAVAELCQKAGVVPDVLLVDGVRRIDGFPGIPQSLITRGDSASVSIAAASIVAKVARDAHMRELHQQHPAYGFAQHKGYGTKAHFSAIARHGSCGVHRLSFKLSGIRA